MGGGIASSIARALGARRRADADALVLHAILIALAFGLVFTVVVLAGGRRLYSGMGGSGGALDAALIYSNWIFAGAIIVWLFNSLAAVIRGTGNMAFPAIVTCAGVVILIPLSPLLIFGWDRFLRSVLPGRGCAACLLSGRNHITGGVSVVQQELVAAKLCQRNFSVGLVQGHSAHWIGRSRFCCCHQCHDRDRRHLRRRFWHRGNCRLWHRRPTGVSAGAPGVRLGRAAGRDGRHMHRRGSA
jgi:hypothetical protein